MFKFTSSEVRDLIIAFFVISLCFAFLFSNRNVSVMMYLLPICMVGVGTGFIFHEIAHKISSMHYGYWAEFKLWSAGLLIALITSFFGFLFAAPGAVYTYGNYIDEKVNGVISLAGPITNIFLAIIFFILSVLIYLSYTPGNIVLEIAFLTCNLGFSINSYLAVFNMLPFFNLDGSKVLRWNGIIWLVVIVIAGFFTYFSMTMGVENMIIAFLGI